jgi:hypothetical protein
MSSIEEVMAAIVSVVEGQGDSSDAASASTSADVAIISNVNSVANSSATAIAANSSATATVVSNVDISNVDVGAFATVGAIGSVRPSLLFVNSPFVPPPRGFAPLPSFPVLLPAPSLPHVRHPVSDVSGAADSLSRLGVTFYSAISP